MLREGKVTGLDWGGNPGTQRFWGFCHKGQRKSLSCQVWEARSQVPGPPTPCLEGHFRHPDRLSPLLLAGATQRRGQVTLPGGRNESGA